LGGACGAERQWRGEESWAAVGGGWRKERRDPQRHRAALVRWDINGRAAARPAATTPRRTPAQDAAQAPTEGWPRSHAGRAPGPRGGRRRHEVWPGAAGTSRAYGAASQGEGEGVAMAMAAAEAIISCVPRTAPRGAAARLPRAAAAQQLQIVGLVSPCRWRSTLGVHTRRRESTAA